MIIKPAVLKNKPDCKFFDNLTDAKLIKPKTGNVPNEKNNIIKEPLTKLPVVNA